MEHQTIKILNLKNYTVIELKYDHSEKCKEGRLAAVNGSSNSIPYKIKGKRKTEYLLVRDTKNPEYLYAVNCNMNVRSQKIHGYRWFKEGENTLIPIK